MATHRLTEFAAVFCLLSFAFQPLRADVFTVTNNGGGTGPNTLGDAINDANTDAFRTDTINITLGSPQTITIGASYPNLSKFLSVTTTMNSSSLVTVDAGTSNSFAVLGGVLDTSNVLFTGSGSLALAINSGTLAVDQNVSAHLFMNGGTLRTKASVTLSTGIVSGNGVFDVQGGGNTTTISGNIGGAGFTKTGAGDLVLTNTANSHVNTTVNAGTLVISSAAALGTGTLTFGTGNLRTDADMTISRAIVTNSNAVFFTNNRDVTLAGDISGAGAVTRQTGGSLTLTGNNSYTGGTFAIGGTLAAGADAALGDASGGLSLDGATFRALGDFSSARAVTLNNFSTVDTNGRDLSLSGIISGDSLTKTGAGTLLLSGANTFNGLTVMSGILAVSTGAALGAGSMALHGSTLAFITDLTASGNVALTGGGFINVASTHTAELSGVVSGTGGILAKSGAGTLVLSGANTFNGGVRVSSGALAVADDAALGAAANPLFLDGGALRALADVSSVRSVSLSNGGSVQLNDSEVALSGVISGTGGLSASGPGDLILTGVNTYTGGTTIAGSTVGFTLTGVSIADDAALGDASGALTLQNAFLRPLAGFSSARNITAAGIFGGVFADNQDVTLTGSIGGGGAFSAVGGGTVTLSGVNSYAGGTNVAMGTILNVGADANLGAATGDIALVSGTLRTTGSFATARDLSLNTVGFIDTNGHDLAVSGVISGAQLVKMGAGTLTASGVNTYSGNTTVLGGTLRLTGAAHALSAVSTSAGSTFDIGGVNRTAISMANAGTLVTGTGQLDASIYGGLGDLSVELRPDGTPNLKASMLTLSGGTLFITGRPTSGTYLVAQGTGLFSGTFGSIVAPSHKLVTPTYLPSGLSLSVVTLSTLNQTGLGRNQAAVASLLDASASTSSGSLDEALGQLNDLAPGAQRQSLTQLSGAASFGAMSGLAFSTSKTQSAALSRRSASLRSSAIPAVFQVADAAADAPAAYFSGDKWGVFASLLAGAGKQDAQDGDGGNQPGYDLSSNGVTVGVDHKLTENFSLGVSLGALSAKADIQDDGGSVENASLRYGVYGTAVQGKFFETFYLGAASNDFDNSRRISGLGQTASASPSGQELNIDLQGGYQWKPSLALLAGLAHDSLTIDGYTETGAGAMNLTVGGQNAESLRFNAGVKTARRLEKKESVFTPSAALSLLHEFKDQGRAVSASLASVGAFQTQTADVSRTGAQVALGLGAAWAKGFSANAAYTGEFRSGYSNHTVTGGLRKTF